MTDDAPITSLVPVAAKKRLANSGKGRVKGVPNKVTVTMRNTARFLAEARADQFLEWIDRVAKKKPDRACDLYIRLLQTYAPKPTQAFEIEAGTAVNPLGQSTVALRLRSLLEGPT